MSAVVRVGIIDSGRPADGDPPVLAMRRFFFDAVGAVEADDANADQIGHGSEVCRLISAAAPKADLLCAQVFDASFRTAPALVAAGLDWLTEEGARIINMSFGLSADRAVLREACMRACDAGAILVASAPAQGEPVYPAAYESVIAVTGDARCAPGEVTDLQGRQADFGTWCASPERGGGALVGASAAAASFSGLIAAQLSDRPETGCVEVLDQLRARAIAVGPERRSAEVPRR